MSKQLTSWSNPTKQKTNFSEASKNKTSFTEGSKQKTSFNEVSKQKTDFNETGEPTYTSVDPTVNDPRVGINDIDCLVNGPFILRTFSTSRQKTSWAE